jgi:hypothetical protein
MPETLEEQEKLDKAAQASLVHIDTLAGQANKDSPSNVLQSIINQVDAEARSVSPEATNAYMVQGASNATIKTVEAMRNEKLAEEEKETAEAAATAANALMAASAADIAFSRQMFQFMSGNEQQFFNGLQGPQSLIMLDSNGQVIADADGKPRIEVVDGTLLQSDFARIKYYTLEKPDQDKIGAPPDESPDGKSLHESLLRLEGEHIAHKMQHGMSLKDAQAESREDFARAHDQVNSTVAVEATAHSLEEAAKKNPILAMNAKIAGLAAKYHEDKLGQDLQTVIDDVSGGKTVSRRHEQGIQVSGPTAQMHIGSMHKEPEHSL